MDVSKPFDAPLSETSLRGKPASYACVTLMFKLLGRRERSLNSEGHIYFFTTPTLQNLCKAAGFRLVELDYVGRSLTLDRLMWNMGVISKSEPRQAIDGPSLPGASFQQGPPLPEHERHATGVRSEGCDRKVSISNLFQLLPDVVSGRDRTP